jgi:hypothetical protein
MKAIPKSGEQRLSREETPMRRQILLLSTAILLVAFAGGFVWAARPVQPVGTAQARSAGDETAHRFYAAINTAIATGNLSAFRAAVASDFVDLAPLPGAGPGRVDLESYLLELNETAPDIRLEVEEMVADGERVTARVAVRGSYSGDVAGFPIVVAPKPWGKVDFLLVEAGKVVERHGLLEGAGRLSSVPAVPLLLDGPTRRVATLERISVPPGATHAAAAELGPHALLIETGNIEVTLHRANEGGGATTGARQEDVVSLVPDAIFVVPANDQYSVMNTGHADAHVLRLTMESPAPGGAAMGAGVTSSDPTAVRTLAGGVATRLPDGQLGVGVARVVLGPGATLSLTTVDGVALVAVEAGQFSASFDGAAYRRDRDGASAPVASATIGQGEGLLIGLGTAFVLRNDGAEPEEALLIAVTRTAA